jgi:hypothetical protein
MLQVRRWVKMYLVALIGAGLLGCTGPSDVKPTKGVEKYSKLAPDGERKAYVLIPESSGYLGATVSTVYQVWIQDLHHTKDEKLLMTASETSGVSLAWSGPLELQICYVKAEITGFRNFFTVATQDFPDAPNVEVLLKKVAKLDECGIP